MNASFARSGCWLALVAALLCTAARAADSGGLAQPWDYISYPAAHGGILFLVRCGEADEEDAQGFCFHILNIPPALLTPKSPPITARLHRADGEIVEPTPGGKRWLNAPISVSTATPAGVGALPEQVLTYFPWGPNALEEAWVEVSLGTEHYWVEVPYGFDRDPKAPLAAAASGGTPRLLPAMKPAGPHEHIVQWKEVQYAVGAIANGWRLLFNCANPAGANGAQTEVTLYREPSCQMPGPRVGLRIADLNGAALVSGTEKSVTLTDGGTEITHVFANAIPKADDSRGWGVMTISVDDKSYKAVVPSSLYRTGHGHAVGGSKGG